MRYQVTCLTPTLVGDGQKLAPIDYMVWKDHVNVLDQRRIFRLLARGPRLDGYLAQLKKAEKLDFGSWGGFAQNYAGRRIPFEHPSSSPIWERARAENLFIPTFASGPQGIYLPAAALRGALRTAAVAGLAQDRLSEQLLKEAAQRPADARSLRHLSNAVEDTALGGGAANAMRLFAAGDSQPVPESAFKIYLLRVSTLEPRGESRFALAWKQAPRGSTRKPEDSTPSFAEMANEGTVFEGVWEQNPFLQGEEVAQAIRGAGRADTAALFAAANRTAERILELHRQYAQADGLQILAASLEKLQHRLAQIRDSTRESPLSCMLSLGWGAGFLSKTAFPDTGIESYRAVLRQLPYYARAIQSNLPFPKTRKILFLQNQPAALPGFVELRITA